MHGGTELAHRLEELRRVHGRDVLRGVGLEGTHHGVVGALVEPAHGGTLLYRRAPRTCATTPTPVRSAREVQTRYVLAPILLLIRQKEPWLKLAEPEARHDSRVAFAR